MAKTYSRDGTPIAFDRVGRGRPLILVDGALCYRASGPSQGLARTLAKHFSVITYDRRGRGDSGNTLPFAVDREVEDIDALIRAIGEPVFVFGISSGAALALEAAQRGAAIEKLALFEAPFIVDDTRAPMPADFRAELDAAVGAGRRGDAVRMFMRLVGVPGFFIALMRVMPAWSKLTAVAHTLPYDITFMADHSKGRPLSATRWSNATMPTLVIDGGKSPVWMRNATRAVADALPNAAYRTLPGQTHMVKPKAVSPALVEFFNG